MTSNDLNDDNLFALKLNYECRSQWKNMTGDERVRFCAACQKNVYNISNMTRQEAVSLIQEREGDLCVRFYERRDGTVVTRDCLLTLGKEALKRKHNWFVLVNAGLAFVANLIMPYLAPAIVTIKMGVGPMMNEPKSEAFAEMGDAAAIGGSDKSDGAR
jgi:hypothetical protein